MKLQTDLQKNIGEIKKNVLENSDIKFREFVTSGGTPCVVVFIDGMTNKAEINEFVIQAINVADPEPKDAAEMMDIVVRSAECEIVETLNDALDGILNGDCIVMMDGDARALRCGVKQWEVRAIAEPPTSTVIKGPREGFNEDIKTNLILLRRKLRSKDLKIDFLKSGKYTNTNIALAYVDGIVDKDLVKEVTKQIEAIDIDGILDSSYIAKYLEKKAYSIFRQVGTSEKPDIVAAKILEGRIAIFVDGSPIVLTVPFILLEDFQSPEDYYERNFRATLARCLRFVGIIIAILIPALFVSAQLFNLELIPLRFTVTVLNAVKGIPLSPALEMLFTVLIFEILNEASIRMPKYVGMALSIVGALVLGETAVRAGIISTPTLMIMALSAISLYTVPELTGTLSLLRIIFILLAGVMGTYGVMLAALFLFVYLVDLQSFSSPYLAPYAPLIKNDKKDSIIKDDLKSFDYRPRSIKHKNNRRQKL